MKEMVVVVVFVAFYAEMMFVTVIEECVVFVPVKEIVVLFRTGC